MIFFRRTLILMIACLMACLLSEIMLPARAQDMAKKTSFVTVRPGVELEVVEWSDSGRPIIFLAGLGHAAHVFDEFAPRFGDDYHAIGITRRGFGASSQPEDGYDLASLATDIKIVMDSLGLEKAIMVGHSVGGDEMTKFTAKFPNRVEALIYLDAAYDRIMERDSLAMYHFPPSNTPEPTKEELASVSAFREYYHKVNGVRLPEAEFRAICEWNPDGSFQGWKTMGSVYGAISTNLESPDYSSIETPALAIYAVNYPITELFGDYPDRDSTVKVQMKAYYDAVMRVNKISRNHFRKAVVNGKVVGIEGAGHSLYITHADQVEKEMREFLGELPD